MLCPFMSHKYDNCEEISCVNYCALYDNKEEKCSITIGAQGMVNLATIMDQCTYETFSGQKGIQISK